MKVKIRQRPGLPDTTQLFGVRIRESSPGCVFMEIPALPLEALTGVPDGSFTSLTDKPTTLVGYGITDAQPLDDDLTAIAALATKAFGRGLLVLADAGAVRVYIGAGTSNFDGLFASLSGKPTTVSGYGITDVIRDINCRVTNGGSISIPNNTFTALTFDTEVQDTDTMHNPGTNPSRLTCKTAGNYYIAASIRFAANATGNRVIGIKLNGGNYIAAGSSANLGASTQPDMGANTMRQLAVNDYVECFLFQDSGGVLDCLAFADFTPVFSMARMA